MSLVYRSAVLAWARMNGYSLTSQQVNEAVGLLQRQDAARAAAHDEYLTQHEARELLEGWLSLTHQQQMKANERPSITCPKCKRVSYHPKDIEHRYCSACGYHDGPQRNRSKHG